ncbi:MAG: hypothetical protein ACOC8X_11815 [Chloroflexota bacterium]
MNKANSKYRIVAITMVLLAALLLAGGAFSQASSGYRINWWTVDGGGGSSSAGQLSLSGTVGQADAGILSGGMYELHGGFWTAAVQTDGGSSKGRHTIALPLIVGGD